MKTTIVFTIFSIIFYVLHIIFKKVYQDDPYISPIRTAVINKIAYAEKNIITYYVSFETEEGDSRHGKSISYAITRDKYKINDIVQIRYFINKNDDTFVKILDDDLVPCKESLKKVSFFCFLVSVIFLMLGIANFCLFM